MNSNLEPGITEPPFKEFRSKLQKNNSSAPSSAVVVHDPASGDSVFVDKNGNNIGLLSKERSHSTIHIQPYSFALLDEAESIFLHLPRILV